MIANPGNLIERLRQAGDRLTRSERCVAEVILQDPEAATRLSIAALAQASGVSEPTVNRFCRKFEPRGYPEFKLRLAQSLVRGVPYLSAAITAGDDTASITGKIVERATSSLAALPSSLSPQDLDQVVSWMLQARQIHFFGMGVSSVVAQDAEQHFFRFALPVSAQSDVLMQRMQAAAATEDELFFLISHTGRTREVVDIASLAAARGARVVSLTAAGSPLAQASTLAIALRIAEDTDAYMPMTSRLAHLVVLDILASALTLRRGDALQPHLKIIKDSLLPTRYSTDGVSP